MSMRPALEAKCSPTKIWMNPLLLKFLRLGIGQVMIVRRRRQVPSQATDLIVHRLLSLAANRRRATTSLPMGAGINCPTW
ncbi:hypothetical protein AWC17_29215 [Mycobacterium nebraskense]|uniref:Uncharacterized protein n=1 Tax=Mycobacterium nebraskense TaxID=244292 RepID=A0A0F5NL05_9MYCO|nr:hypothetical protein WU83_00075 [Mycobacterium nebraskense]KLO46658.1 hypothetical protein ABW17_02105 [Mycobacterium nebraskense]ORW27039.1 hypothetical protein AWC17_29215 [Mycobacterium nebraskense]